MSDEIKPFVPKPLTGMSDEWTALQCLTAALSKCQADQWKQCVIVFVDSKDNIATLQAAPSKTQIVGLLQRSAIMVSLDGE